MSALKIKGPIVDSGICRCCGGTKKCRLLNAEYDFQGEKEIYSDMIMDCFGLLLSHLDGKVMEKLVCATCVRRLRDAKDFRKQVLQCEEAFLQMKMYDGELQELDVPVVKLEPKNTSDVDSMRSNSPLDCDADDDDDLKNEDDDSNDDKPLLSLKLSKLKTKDPNKTKKKVKLKKKHGNIEHVKKATINNVANKKMHPLVKQELMQRRSELLMLKRRKAIERQKLILKMEQDQEEKDKTYMTLHNVTTIIENSYVCPFRCRHNNIHCYYCKLCITDPEKLRDHTATHNPKKFVLNEYRTTVKIDITKIDCRLCAVPINDLDAFKVHVTMAHGKTFYEEAADFVLPFRLHKNTMSCVYCEKSFMYFHAVNQHMNEHCRNYVCETCGLGFVDQSRLIAHKPKHEIGMYPCEECGKTFKNEMYKDLHVDRVHKKLGKVYCPKCDVRLMSYHQKRKHLVEVHGEEPLQLACTSCDKIFECRRYLTLHLRKYHIKDFRYECEYCGQKFFTHFSLKNHLPTHTGERNFKCKVCDKSYPRLKTLKEHIRIHTNDRRYRCQICGQAFIQNCSLKGHMRSQHPEYG